MTNGIGPQS
jgi:hypothetical protein